MPINRCGKYALDDIYLRERLSQVIVEYKINTVVETGLNEGLSTREFARMVPSVIGIDVDKVCIEEANRNLIQDGKSNYRLILGDSPSVLKELVKTLDVGHTLFLLDAHWGSWPLPDEIRALPKGKGIFVLHDIKVPGKDFGYDGYEYQGKIISFEYDVIKDVITEWSATHRIEYNTQASGSYRGAAIVFPV